MEIVLCYLRVRCCTCAAVILEFSCLRSVKFMASVCGGGFLAEISLVICDHEEKAASLLENKEKGVTPKLSCLVLFCDFSEAFVERAKASEVEVLKLEQLMVSRVETLNSCNAVSLKCLPFNQC